MAKDEIHTLEANVDVTLTVAEARMMYDLLEIDSLMDALCEKIDCYQGSVSSSTDSDTVEYLVIKIVKNKD